MLQIILMLAIDWKSHQSGGLYKGLYLLFTNSAEESLSAKTEVIICIIKTSKHHILGITQSCQS